MPTTSTVPASAEAAIVANFVGQYLSGVCEESAPDEAAGATCNDKKGGSKGAGDRAVCAVLSASEWLDAETVAGAAERSNVLTRAVLNRLWKDGVVDKCHVPTGCGVKRLWRLRRPGLPQALYEAVLGTDFGPLAECFDNESYTDWRPKCLA